MGLWYFLDRGISPLRKRAIAWKFKGPVHKAIWKIQAPRKLHRFKTLKIDICITNKVNTKTWYHYCFWHICFWHFHLCSTCNHCWVFSCMVSAFQPQYWKPIRKPLNCLILAELFWKLSAAEGKVFLSGKWIFPKWDYQNHPTALLIHKHLSFLFIDYQNHQIINRLSEPSHHCADADS